MNAAYQIRIYDTSGNLQYVLGLENDVRNFTIEHRVNYPSTLQLALYELSEAVQYFTLDRIVEVRRRVQEASLDWYTEFVGFSRTPQRQITESDTRIFTVYCRGLLDLIRRRSIRYYSTTNGSDKGPAPADDVIKDYVRENAGSLATVTNGRITDGVTDGLTVQSNLGQAAAYEGAHAWKNLLEAIREIGESNQVDFSVEWLGPINPIGFIFRTYYPQLGTDRREGTSDPFVFATNLGNMRDPSFTQSRTDEVTSVLVLGPGEGPLRDTTLRTSTRMTDSPWNLIEQDQNASQEDRLSALQAIGDDVLYQKRAANSLKFATIQTPQSTYHQHYHLGDLVTGKFSVVSSNVKIRAVTVNVAGPREEIGLELEEV